MRRSRNWKSEGPVPFDIHPTVFPVSAALIFVFVLIAILFEGAGELFSDMKTWMSTYMGWSFVLVMNVVLLFCIVLMLGRYGKVRLGGAKARPEFSTGGWFAMLFSAGMGIGLLFYGVAEPIYHFSAPPTAEAGTVEAAREAMKFTFLHWGLHPWGIYALVGLALAFFTFNRGLPLSVRSIFHPLIGDRIYHWPGNVIDILATVATMFGVATSLGLGVQQVNAGLHIVSSQFLPFVVPETPGVQVLLIAIITGFATLSVVKGLDSGIQTVSKLNMYIAGALLLFVFLVGPTLFILNGFVEHIGAYLQELPSLATWGETYENSDWQNGWTIFYYAWWIAWSPFVGMFIARISYGRTVREFLLGVLLVPTALTFFWMTVFGDGALYIELLGGGGMVEAVQASLAGSLFAFLGNFPLEWLTASLSVLVVITFFVTSSDSGSLVIDIITAGGNTDPPTPQRVFWAVTEGVVAAALMLGGGLAALQTAAITTGLPFAIVILFMCRALQQGLRESVDGQAKTVSGARESEAAAPPPSETAPPATS